MIVLAMFGAIMIALGVYIVATGYDDDASFLIGILIFATGMLMVLGGTGVIAPDPTCDEYGTVLVTVDGDQRCVPWEQAPDLQDFPQP